MPKEFFISEKSQKFIFFNSLRLDPKARHEHQLCLVFGKKNVEELKSIQAIVTTQTAKDTPLFQTHDRYILSEKSFKKLSALATPEPYGALVKLPSFKLPKTPSQGILILDELSDPGNVGTLFRTAMGLGLDALVLLAHTVDPYHPKVMSASKGACLQQPWVKVDLSTLKDYLTQTSLPTFYGDLAGQALHKVAIKGPFALILGHEARGVSPFLKSLGHPIHIPQHHIESYNVAIAGAIMAYTLLDKANL